MRTRTLAHALAASVVFVLTPACAANDEGSFGNDPTAFGGPDGGGGSARGGHGSPSSDDGGTASPNDDAAAPQDDGGAPPPPRDDAGDPYGTPPQCTSNRQWLLGDVGNAEMHPGKACDTCHKLGGSATKFMFDVAGTVYPTAHEPDDCYGAAGATVVITDANGKDHTLTVNAAGNFYNFDYVGLGAIPTPYHAKVVKNGKERAMVSAETSGDCNSCHTESGAMTAPGRIMLP